MLRSFPGGMAAVGRLRLGITAAAFALVPVLVGGTLLLALQVFGPETPGQPHVRMMALATLAILTPLVGVPIWGAVAVGAGLLLARGGFGWLPAAVLGAAAFAILIRTDIGPVSLPFGAVSGMLYRMALALQRPEAF